MHFAKRLRNAGGGFGRIVNHDRQQERCIIGHVMSALDRQAPLTSKIALGPRIGMSGDDRDEQCAVVQLLADLPIPGVPAPQFALVEPDLDARGAQGLADPQRRR